MIHTMHNGFSKSSISQLWSKFAIWGPENPNAARGALTVSHLWTGLLFFLLINFRYWHSCIMLNSYSKHKQMVEIERALLYDVKTFGFCMQGKYGIPVTKLKLRLSQKEVRLFFLVLGFLSFLLHPSFCTFVWWYLDYAIWHLRYSMNENIRWRLIHGCFDECKLNLLNNRLVAC
jgi:hypothetical protein